MRPATKRAVAGPSRRRRIQDDSDEDSDESIDLTPPPVQEFTEEERKRNAELAQLADLGSGRRGFLTAVDKGPQQRVNVRQIFEGRDCNQEGTEAAEFAAQNKPQLAGWSNFGNTAVAQDGTYEVLPDIAAGQSHRNGVATRLRDQGILNLADSYNNRSRRHAIPPPMASQCGGMFGAARGGAIGRGGRQGPISSNRPLDPAIVDGEKDSRYGNGGLQSRNKVKLRSSVRIEDTTVKVTASSIRGGRLADRPAQPRPWPPAALEHLDPPAKLATSVDFMAFVNKQITKKPEPKPSAAPPTSLPKRPEPKTSVAQPTLVPPGSMEQATSTKALGVSAAPTATKEKAPIQQAPREDFRPPHVSPSSLTEGRPSPVVSEEAAIGLGISGLDLERAPTASKVEIEVAILRTYIEANDVDGLLKFLGSLLKIERGGRPVTTATQATPALVASNWASPVEETPRTTKITENPFGANEPVIAKTATLPTPESAKPKPKPKPKPAPSSTKSKSLSESKWATGAPTPRPIPRPTPTTSALQSRSTNGVPRYPLKNDSPAIFGDLKNVFRLPEDEPARRMKATQTSHNGPKEIAIKRTKPGAGFDELVAEYERMKIKAPSPEVNAALNTAKALGAAFGAHRGQMQNDDGNESEESEL